VMEFHGWGEVADQLRLLSRRGQWSEMMELISEEMVETFATVAPQAQLAEALKERYMGLVDRVTLYLPYIPGDRDTFWKTLIQEIKVS
jgi:hypothetical protein